MHMCFRFLYFDISAKSHKRVRSLSSTDHRQQPKRKQTRMITDFFSKGISSSGQHTPDSGSNISRTELNNTTRTDGTHDTGFNTSRAELNGTTETDGTHDSRFNTPTADLNDTTQTDGTHDSGSNISGTEFNVNDTTETDVQLQQTTIQEPILDDTTPDLNSTQEIAQSLHVPTLTRDEISPYPNDIGSIFRPNMSSMEASSTAMSLNDQQRYNLLTNHFSPSQNYKFKPVFQNGCNRRCSRNFNTAYPWLVFSDCQNGVFCIHCALFAKNRSKLNQFVNSPFNNWYKFKEKVEIHAQRPYHRESVLASQAFNDKMTNPSSTLPHIINRELEQRVTTNRHILKHIIKALLFCAKQCIGLRGTIETFHMTPTVNPGNFIAFLRDRAEDDEILREHLLFPQKKMRNMSVLPARMNS
ncbi:unnamed protein product [Mytilus edulis]|uniref:TTF-type domain-containing protein n=1 Tax=Mytilus edulis TaxID=6550 RepID=A0A8S3RR85_MYTED|nr:unnamed protein product [Mytilus edulis]